MATPASGDRVAAFRQRYPLNVRDLDAGHVGRAVLIAVREEPWTYAGRRARYHTLHVPGHGLGRLPTVEERAQRCAVADQPSDA